MQLLLFLTIGKLLSIIVGLLCYKLLSPAFRIALLQVVVAMCAEIYGYYLSTNSDNNLWFFNFYWLVEMWIVGWIAMKTLTDKRIIRIITYLLLTATFILALNIYIHGVKFYANWGISFICITLVIVYLIVLFNNLFGTKKLLTDAIFWFSISILLFYGCLLPYYGLFNFLYSRYPDILNQFFNITIALDFIRYPIVALSFYLFARRQKAIMQENTSVV